MVRMDDYGFVITCTRPYSPRKGWRAWNRKWHSGEKEVEGTGRAGVFVTIRWFARNVNTKVVGTCPGRIVFFLWRWFWKTKQSDERLSPPSGMYVRRM